MFKSLVLISFFAATATAQFGAMPQFPKACLDKCKVAETLKFDCDVATTQCLESVCKDLIKLKPCIDCANLEAYWDTIQMACGMLGGLGGLDGLGDGGKSDDGAADDDDKDADAKPSGASAPDAPKSTGSASASASRSGMPAPSAAEDKAASAAGSVAGSIVAAGGAVMLATLF